MRLIDADKYVCALVFDEEHEEQRAETMTIEDFLDSFTEEGCPVQEVTEMKWIPCSERLPDVAQRVLLSGHGEVMIGRLHSFGKYSLEPTGISYIYPKGDIKAWMPLPEPYKEGNDEVN